MKTVVIKVNSSGTGMQDALDLSENLAADVGLSRSENLRLRLLAEELFGMLRSIAGGAEASYWIEYEGKSFTIHLDTDIPLSQERRKHLLSVSTSGTNSEAKGIMGKIQELVEVCMENYDEVGKLQVRYGVDPLSYGMMGMDTENMSQAMLSWSLKQYRDNLEEAGESNSSYETAWDELEKSVVANLADDVRVGIKNGKVDMEIYKTFKS